MTRVGGGFGLLQFACLEQCQHIGRGQGIACGCEVHFDASKGEGVEGVWSVRAADDCLRAEFDDELRRLHARPARSGQRGILVDGPVARLAVHEAEGRRAPEARVEGGFEFVSRDGDDEFHVGEDGRDWRVESSNSSTTLYFSIRYFF